MKNYPTIKDIIEIKELTQTAKHARVTELILEANKRIEDFANDGYSFTFLHSKQRLKEFEDLLTQNGYVVKYDIINVETGVEYTIKW